MKTLLISLLFICGCTNIGYTVIKPDGETHKIDLNRLGYDTKIGLLDVKTPDGVTVHLENVDSQEKASNVFNKLIDKIPNAPPIIP